MGQKCPKTPNKVYPKITNKNIFKKDISKNFRIVNQSNYQLPRFLLGIEFLSNWYLVI